MKCKLLSLDWVRSHTKSFLKLIKPIVVIHLWLTCGVCLPFIWPLSLLDLGFYFFLNITNNSLSLLVTIKHKPTAGARGNRGTHPELPHALKVAHLSPDFLGWRREKIESDFNHIKNAQKQEDPKWKWVPNNNNNKKTLLVFLLCFYPENGSGGRREL